MSTRKRTHRDSVLCPPLLYELWSSSVEHPVSLGDQHWDGSDGVGILCGVLRQGLLPYGCEEGGGEVNERLKEGRGGKGML